eukprot:CAMPEP_0172092310 /NCGR_PEP_ID=MMETSP1043-20130122/25372_1 /TAXON_ID=464988 /ORGANISM="Hemiselmis andersenii, Strain CCMP441" /LENGTH=86 /DNA_ID=CAMNT_0012755019 /DNA_START=248 /DNA_END=505 /DNA_ORIENTATION=-
MDWLKAIRELLGLGMSSNEEEVRMLRERAEQAEQGKWEAEENAEAEIRKRQRSECGDLAVISDLGMETRAPIPEEPPTRRMPAVLW